MSGQDGRLCQSAINQPLVTALFNLVKNPNPMNKILKYTHGHETELLALLSEESDWSSFLDAAAIDTFRQCLLETETYVCESEGQICGYLRAIVDGFGVYVSELYVAPQHRGNGFGVRLLGRIKQAFPNQEVYVLSDEDLYYEKLGYQRIGSIFQL
ncbi:GNAT family N-acetyltransferase [Pseudohongiella spirulinae]|uniref:N-acetyltransferase domain-containing protein n=1 Tax=Pseudohongiella spirulinae TaxID=1249552 RepID=A0A0S2KBT3_9GAMM|nr:GNAT family N-acetyltransferase [Pseudohongiella spirulinae]ALO45768.1 hypothetical protein PS2015_1106 [Pseudohongiella spirulinae]